MNTKEKNKNLEKFKISLNSKSKVMILVSMIMLIFLDQLTKWLALIFLKGKEPFSLIKGIMSFSFVKNTGVAFGMLSNYRYLTLILSTILLVGVVILIFSNKMPKHKIVYISTVLIASGGLGNLIDRVFRKYVIDFIWFELIDFPVFNIADCFVVVGSILLIIYIIFVHEDKKDSALIQSKTEEVMEVKDEVTNKGKTHGDSGGRETPRD